MSGRARKGKVVALADAKLSQEKQAFKQLHEDLWEAVRRVYRPRCGRGPLGHFAIVGASFCITATRASPNTTWSSWSELHRGSFYRDRSGRKVKGREIDRLEQLVDWSRDIYRGYLRELQQARRKP